MMLGRIAFSAKLRRPGCVLLQAALGGSANLAQRFPTETWLVGGEPGFKADELKVYAVRDEAELNALISLAVKHTKGAR